MKSIIAPAKRLEEKGPVPTSLPNVYGLNPNNPTDQNGLKEIELIRQYNPELYRKIINLD